MDYKKVLRLHFTKVTIFIAALTYSDYFYVEGMTECDIKN